MDILDRILGEEGIKTDIKVSIAPASFIYLGVALFVGMIASRVVGDAMFGK
jgi:hypothetical protein